VARFLAWFLTLLILLQSFSQELLVVQYQARKARITQLFCVNKARPQLHCDGKCYLARQLRQRQERESKAPATGLTKAKFEALPLGFEVLLPSQVQLWPVAAPRGAVPPAPVYAFAWAGRLLRPPVAVG
jgi:hypothetical protein